MSYRPSSPDGALIQIAITLGRMEQRLQDLHTQTSNHARALDTLIRILQSTQYQPQRPQQDSHPSRPSMLATLGEKIGGKLSVDLAMKILWRAAQVAIPYLLPWAIVLWGLAKGVLKFLGLF